MRENKKRLREKKKWFKGLASMMEGIYAEYCGCGTEVGEKERKQNQKKLFRGIGSD